MKTTLLSFTLAGLAMLATPALFAQTFANPVREVDRPEKAAITGRCDLDMTSGSNQSCTIYTPPAGKRLVVEHVNLACTIPASSSTEVTGGYIFTYLTNQGAVATPFVVKRVAYSGFANKIYMTSQPVRLYADAGLPVSVSMFRTSGSITGTSNCIVTFSGYLVNVP